MESEKQSVERVNAAVVVGVVEYESGEFLSAAESDANFVCEILAATKKYEHIFKITNSVPTSKLTSKMTEISQELEGVAVNEFFFYFSGHGYITDGDFIFCTSDFRTDKPRTTAVPNRDIDQWLRSFDPEIAVKVIDACHSGARVIKRDDAFRKSLESKGFHNFIQFASSMEQEVSFASSLISYFTKVFLEGASVQKSNKILYTDIENYILDSFSSAEQTPYFISQSTRRETFCESSHFLADFHKKICNLSANSKTSVSDVDQKLAELSEYYPSISEVQDEVEELSEEIGGIDINDETLTKVYACERSSFSDYQSVPKAGVIAKALAEEQRDRPLVQIVSKEVSTDFQLPNPFQQTQYKTVYQGLKPKSDIGECVFCLKASPRHPAFVPLSLYLVLVPFRSYCRIFCAIVDFDRTDWSEYEMKAASVQWNQYDFTWGSVSDALKEIGELNKFWSVLEKMVQEKLSE